MPFPSRWAGLVLILLCFSQTLSAAPSTTDTKHLVSLFEARYRAAHTLEATFLERYMENSRVTRTEAGIAYFRRPGRMRWEYESPEKNLFLVDGKFAWFYVPADHTVTRVPAKQSGDWRTPLALLAGEMKTSRVCARITPATELQPENPDHAVLFCQLKGVSPDKSQAPDSPPASEAVFFEINKGTGELIRILVRDPGGVSIEFRFANWKIDPPLSESFFHFAPPQGVAIVNGELPSDPTSVRN
jgi:outer membrane lipoprotein carrier protein